ncbi:MAG: DMT family transporter [Hyphomicrobiaceae bacterium TMED74]|nr:EamA family transporter [Filomicrobium sp.]RPG48064.1 MAG: DMT family transporter [Hyphomicrobiaceae bacterium TMED74]
MQDRQQSPAFGWLTNNGLLLAVVCTLIWGGNAIAGKFAVGNVSPLMLTMCRWILAATIMVIWGWSHLRNDWPVIRQNLVYLFFAGALGFAAFNGLLYTALKYSTAINITILQSAMPMFVFLLNFLVFGLRMHWAQALGYSITLIGVLLVAGQGDFTRLASLDVNFGDLVMLVAVVVYSAYSVALRAKPAMHWMSFLAVLVISATIASIPMAAVEYALGETIVPTNVTGWMVVFYTALFPSIVSQGFWIRTNELLGGNTASLFFNLVPIFGAILAVLILGETFHIYHAIALTMVVGGIVIAQQLAK